MLIGEAPRIFAPARRQASRVKPQPRRRFGAGVLPRTARGPEVLEPDDVQRYVAKRDALAALEAFLERHAVDGGQQVDALRRLTELDHRVGAEISRNQPERSEAEVVQRFEQAREVGGGRPDPEVDVARVARTPMRRERIAANDGVLSAPPD